HAFNVSNELSSGSAYISFNAEHEYKHLSTRLIILFSILLTLRLAIPLKKQGKLSIKSNALLIYSKLSSKWIASNEGLPMTT
ncbi:hypothetical protein, partial [Vibrio cholerae]|uniref:hypothetical protein n=1 Tax=Vibrio cholerae TaxID=666 RepID=UPI001F19DAAD